MAEYRLVSEGVRHEPKNMLIPEEPANADWRRYQRWVAAGGIPDPKAVPAEPVPADVAEQVIAGNVGLTALVRWVAKDKGITERALLDEIRAEATAK